MRIIIKSIEANLIDTSTIEEDNYLIKHWVIKYEILFIEEGHNIQGSLDWTAVPNIYKIIKFIKWFYGKRNTNITQPT